MQKGGSGWRRKSGSPTKHKIREICFGWRVIFQFSKPNPVVPLSVADDQGPLSPSAFSECQPTDLTDNRRPSYGQWDLGNDPRGLRMYSDERSPLPTGPTRHPMTRPAALPGAADV